MSFLFIPILIVNMVCADCTDDVCTAERNTTIFNQTLTTADPFQSHVTPKTGSDNSALSPSSLSKNSV